MFLMLGRTVSLKPTWTPSTTNYQALTVSDQRVGLISDGERERSGRTSALYILIRPWLTLDQEGTALMLHSWLECSANGPVFIYRTETER